MYCPVCKTGLTEDSVRCNECYYQFNDLVKSPYKPTFALRYSISDDLIIVLTLHLTNKKRIFNLWKKMKNRWWKVTYEIYLDEMSNFNLLFATIERRIEIQTDIIRIQGISKAIRFFSENFVREYRSVDQ